MVRSSFFIFIVVFCCVLFVSSFVASELAHPLEPVLEDVAELWALAPESVHGAAAAAHGCVACAELVHLFLYVGEGGVLGEDALFELVVHVVSPFAYGEAYDVGERLV